MAVADYRHYPCVQGVETLLMLSKLKRWERTTAVPFPRLVRTLEPLYLPPQSRSTFWERNICQGFLRCCDIRQRARRYC